MVDFLEKELGFIMRRSVAIESTFLLVLSSLLPPTDRSWISRSLLLPVADWRRLKKGNAFQGCVIIK